MSHCKWKVSSALLQEMKWDEPHPNVKCTTSSCCQWVDSKPYSSTRCFFRYGADCSHLTYRHQEQHLILSIDIGIVHQEQLHHLGGVLPDSGACLLFLWKPMVTKLLQEELDANEWSFFSGKRNIGSQNLRIFKIATTKPSKFRNIDFSLNNSQLEAHLVDGSVQRGHTFRILLVHLCTYLVGWFTNGWLLSRWEKLMEKMVGFLKSFGSQKKGHWPLYHDISLAWVHLTFVWCMDITYMQSKNLWEHLQNPSNVTSISAKPQMF